MKTLLIEMYKFAKLTYQKRPKVTMNVKFLVAPQTFQLYSVLDQVPFNQNYCKFEGGMLKFGLNNKS
jgi:hypothetical protein